jgi:hypothetical protein
MEPLTEFSGGCLCGAVRYSCSSQPVAMVNCHCRDCQRAGGAAYSPTVVVPAQSLRITQGQPKIHRVSAESGNEASRAFCVECGSHLFAFSSGRTEFVGVKAGSLDDPSWFKPMVDAWVSSAQPWDCLDPAIPKMPKGRPTDRR